MILVTHFLFFVPIGPFSYVLSHYYYYYYHYCYYYLLLLSLLTLSAHAREGYSSHFVCHSVTLCVTFWFWRRRRFQGWNLHQYILGDDLSPLNVALSWKSKLFWRKSEWNFGRNCSDLLGQCPVIKRFSTWSFSMWNPLPKLHLRCSHVGFFPSRSYIYGCRLADCFPFQ